MTAVAITTSGAFIPAAACARIRHPLMRDLAAAQRDRISVDPEIVATIEMIDNVGAAWENKKVSDVSSDVSPVDSGRCDPAGWTSMTVSATAAELKITPQAARGLLKRKSLHGEQQPDRTWRVCAESVTARLEGAKCQH
jgi:hypothetical protein